ncbi:hypothetical protein JW968_06265 [Candidatus Woesearchaeota archaeon]|nr:hypothetical protein [Candidatus Woesearchaeota archaeon]
MDNLESRLVFAGPSLSSVSFEDDYFRADYHWISSGAKRVLQSMNPRNTMRRLFWKAKELYGWRVRQRKTLSMECSLEKVVAYGKSIGTPKSDEGALSYSEPKMDERTRSYARVTQKILSAKRMSKKIASLTAMYLNEYIKRSKYAKSRDY